MRHNGGTAVDQRRAGTVVAGTKGRQTATLTGLVGLVWLAALSRTARRMKPTPTPAQHTVAPDPAEDASRGEPEFGYDVRRGAAAFAPIIGTVGGFVVPAVVLVFELASRHAGAGNEVETLLGIATAFLVLGLIACVLGAFAFAALGAERKTTPSLIAASMYAGAGTVIGAVAIMAAFDALAACYLKDTKDLFASITIGSALAGTILVGLVVADAWTAKNPPQHWLRTRPQCRRWSLVACVSTCIPIAVSGGLRLLGVSLSANGDRLHLIVGAGIVLAIAGALGAMFRTTPRDSGAAAPLAIREVVGVMGLLTIYLMGLLLIMP